MSTNGAAAGSRLVNRLRPWALWLAGVLCIVSLGLAAAPVILHLGGDGDQIGLVTSPQRGAEGLGAPVDLDPILSFAPFGENSLPTPEAQTTDETPLGLTLLGVTIGDRVAASRAIISGGDMPVASYAAGAQVTADVRLVEIDADHVVLNVDGERLTLSFPQRSQPAGGQSREPEREARPATPEQQEAAPVETPDGLDDTIARYREAIDADAEGFLDGLGLKRTETGFEIGQQPAEELLAAGFLPGDVLIRINGQQFDEVDALLQQFDEVVGSGQVRVELQRDGNIVAMSFLLR